MKIVPHEVHIECLRVLMNETMKVSKHHKIIGVINNEIAKLRGKSGTEIIPSYEKDEEVRRGNNIRVPDREDMFQGIEEYLMVKILNDYVFRIHMSQAVDIEEGKAGTAQMFLFLKHYLCWMFPLVVGSRIEVCTTTAIPLINSGKWEVVLIPQFIEPPNPFMHSIGHFILNIVDVKERHVYIVNTLSRNRPKLYK